VKTLTQIISPIAAELQQFETFFGQTLKAETEPMNTIMQYVHETKGKRLRPILVLLSAKLFGEPNEQTLRAATFVEMVHSTTLIHDDVVDDADTRRGQASVKAHFGNLSAVLAGDYLLAKAMLLIANDTDILNEMLRTAAAMSEGELMQNQNQSNYIDIITRKTAMLMRSCCVAGALSVNASPEKVQQIADFGMNFGILFQLRDDILDSENVALAQSLLPIYHEKTLKTLEGFPPSEIVEALHDLTMFCAKRAE
jgi:octaprenyl-diphosphate synthase